MKLIKIQKCRRKAALCLKEHVALDVFGVFGFFNLSWNVFDGSNFESLITARSI